MPIGETIAVAAAKTVFEKASPAIFSKIAERLTQPISKLRVQFTKTFQGHISDSLKRSKDVKTITSKDKAISLEKIYVPLTLTSDDDTSVTDDSINPTISLGSRFVVSGTGGAGKTILMKHLLNKSINNSNGMVPLYFELRTLDFSSRDMFLDVLWDDMKLSGLQEAKPLFVAALEEGLFSIFLDGFDEIRPTWQQIALTQIDRFSRKYHTCSIIISTRPKTGAQELPDFTTYHINPLTKHQALEVIRRTVFEKSAKEKFYAAMDEFLYDKHNTLMSIPILIVMMLLTFRSYPDIPDRMTVFYAQAFNTLYAIHDSENKLQFKREHRSNLAPDLFKRVLEAFCYLSLKNYDLEFTHNSFIDYIGKAIKVSQIETDAQGFGDDLVQNVCILQPDGVSFVFVHRSFQEYFAANFALGYSGDSAFDVIDKIVGSRGSSTGLMMDEIDKAKFRRAWLLPKLEHTLKFLESYAKKSISERLNLFFVQMSFSKEGMVGLKYNMEQNIYSTCETLQPFFERDVSMLRCIINEDWVSDNNMVELEVISDNKSNGFVTKLDGSDGVLRYMMKFNNKSDGWLGNTKIHNVLEAHLNSVRQELKTLILFVETQDRLESELLGI